MNTNTGEYGHTAHGAYQNEGYFQNCTNLEYVKFGKNSLKRLVHQCFHGCSNPNLKIDLNDSTVFYEISDRSLSGCGFERLEDCIINYDFDNLQILGSIGSNQNLKKVKIYRNIHTIEAGAFAYCPNLTEFEVVENGVDLTVNGIHGWGELGSTFFQTNIKTINWHSRVKAIVNVLAWGCTTNMIFENTTPPSLSGETVFRRFDGKIYVPDDYVNDYKSAWLEHISADKIYPISEYVA